MDVSVFFVKDVCNIADTVLVIVCAVVIALKVSFKTVVPSIARWLNNRDLWSVVYEVVMVKRVGRLDLIFQLNTILILDYFVAENGTVWRIMYPHAIIVVCYFIVRKRATGTLKKRNALPFVVDLVLDYVLTFDFRSTAIIGPYILLYYVGLWGLIGYSSGAIIYGCHSCMKVPCQVWYHTWPV